MIRHARVTVGTTPTLLTGTEGDTYSGARLHVRNISGTVSAFLGGSDVTATTGYELPVGGVLDVTLDAGETLYAVVAVGTVRIDVLRAGV